MNLWKEIKYWSQILLLPLYGFSHLVPRNKNIWVLGSTFGRHFADNPKYFYLYLSQHQKQVRAIWISANKDIIKLLRENNIEAYYSKSIKGIWYSLRARVYLYDNYAKDINFWLSGGAVKINLWHGIPLKKINMDNKFDSVRHPQSRWMKYKYALRRLSDEKPYHYVLSPSNWFAPIFSSAFATKKVLCCGYPRNEFLICDLIDNIYSEREISILQLLRDRKQSDQTAKIVLYMPTFRDSEAEFFSIIDFKKLKNTLKEHHIMLCIKPHTKSKWKKEYSDLACENIVYIDSETDPYVFLKDTDALITDYSSIYFDYLLLDKPVIFFCYDLRKYLEASREMYFDYEKFTPGIKVHTEEELLKSLSKLEGMAEDIEISQKRLEIFEKAFDYGNKDACEKLYDAITKGILKNK